MAVKYNINSNGTKNKRTKIQWQCNVHTSERACILRPGHVKKSTQQSLCINFVRRRSSVTLGNMKLNCSWHCYTRAISDVLNSFINSRLMTKSNDWVWVLIRGHASRPYNKTGMHLLFMSCNVTSYIGSASRTASLLLHCPPLHF